MIHHISIGAHAPERVARALAELIGGEAMPFPPAPGAWVTVTDDPHGTMLEVNAWGTQQVPGSTPEGVEHGHDPYSPQHHAFHAAISVACSEADIRRVAAREGWEVRTCSRGDVFHVVECWVENHTMIELLPPEMAREYLAFAGIGSMKRLFGFAA